MLIDNWPDLLRTIVAGIASYAFLVVVLRTSGKRTLVRVSMVSRLVKSEPRLLLHNGRLLPQAMKRERVTEDELQPLCAHKGWVALPMPRPW